MNDPELHRKLDAIFNDKQAYSHFMQTLISLCMQGLVSLKYKHGKITESQYKEWIEKPPIKLLEEYGITYQQYRSLVGGKGMYATGLTFQRAMERNGFNFSAIFYSEKLINFIYNSMISSKPGIRKMDLTSNNN